MFKMNSTDFLDSVNSVSFCESWVIFSFYLMISFVCLLPFVCWVSCSLSVCCLIDTRLKIFTLNLDFASVQLTAVRADNLHRYSRLELKVFHRVSSHSLWPETCWRLWRCFNVSSCPDCGDEITAFGSSLSSNDVAFLDRRQRLPVLVTWPHNNCDFYPLWLWIESDWNLFQLT